MHNLNNACYDPATMAKSHRFSHIYVEQRIKNLPRTREILSHFPKAQIILIEHYKDVFCRRGQDYVRQHDSQALILAEKTEHFLYEAAPVCQDFGNANFYYCSTMMNCVFDCDYCYLKGMYPSGHLVVFVNLEDYFDAIRRELQTRNLYVCVSYDADLLALEGVFGYGKLWAEFAAAQPGLQIEIRTKSGNCNMWAGLLVSPRVIYAFTMSPQRVITESEHGTASAAMRLECAITGLQKGHPVRLCFDPMLYVPDWQQAYSALLKQADERLSDLDGDWNLLQDVSVGSFRISQDYLKKLRKCKPGAAVIQFPFENVGGVYQYPRKLAVQMETWLVQELEKRLPMEKIYRDFRSAESCGRNEKK